MRRKRRRKRDLIEQLLAEYDDLSEAEQLEIRLKWLEQKVVDCLWMFIRLASIMSAFFAAWLVAFFAAWLAGETAFFEHTETMITRRWWISAPVFLIAWAAIGLWLNRSVFRGAPPPIELLDPDVDISWFPPRKGRRP